MKKILLATLLIWFIGCGRSTSDQLEQLRSQDSAQRLHAVKALGERGSEADVVVPALVGALRDPDAFIRRDAAAALGKIGPEARDALPALLVAWRDKNLHVRQEAGKALKRIDPDAAGKVGVR
jgi:HEAT repeat protein